MMICEDCIYSDIVDWGKNKETGKAIPVWWCEKYKRNCEDIKACNFFDNGEVES